MRFASEQHYTPPCFLFGPFGDVNPQTLASQAQRRELYKRAGNLCNTMRFCQGFQSFHKGADRQGGENAPYLRKIRRGSSEKASTRILLCSLGLEKLAEAGGSTNHKETASLP
jgi:hypothetical protein